MKKVMFLLACGSMLFGCATTHGQKDKAAELDFRPILSRESAELNASIIAAIQTQDQAAIARYTSAFLNGEVQIPEAYLRDRQPFGRALFVIMCHDQKMREIPYYYGVEKISDYFLCLLEFKYGVDSREILISQSSALPPGCSDHEEKCRICNSGVSTVDDAFRDALVKYWLEKQARSFSCGPPVWTPAHR